jgi:hypothetical protein
LDGDRCEGFLDRAELNFRKSKDPQHPAFLGNLTYVLIEDLEEE